MKGILAAAVLAAVSPAFAHTDGWDNIRPSRQGVEPVKVLWEADLSKGLDAFAVERFGGAEGTVEIERTASGPALRIVKTNAAGYILVTPKESLTVRDGTELQGFAAVSSERSDPDYSVGFLRLYGRTRDLTYYSRLDGRGAGGPMMNRIFNTSPGTTCRKLCRYLATAKEGLDVTLAIVVAGQPSESRWHRVGIEDLKASKASWSRFIASFESADHAADRQDEAAFAAALAADRDHVARVTKRDGRSVLEVDGRSVPPVVYKGRIAHAGNNRYCGRKMERAGIDLQVVTLRLGDSPKVPGFWTRKGFDVDGAVRQIRDSMRMAPKSLFFLTLILDAYPEFSAEHPDEVWRTEDGSVVWGNQTHADFALARSEKSEGRWPWMSYHSTVWREAVKGVVAGLVSALKAEGLAKRIVGVHLGGYHDHQFATRHADYSRPAAEAFRRWQAREYGKVLWTEPPHFEDTAFLVPGRDDARIAYTRFLKTAPFEMLEDVARHVKGCFAKDIVAVRWCMGAFGGTLCSAYDITPFSRSTAIDIIAPQANYERRVPGVSIGQRMPSASFHEHGKLYLCEFDLRTYGAISGGETELRVTGLSQALDDEMWATTYRKLAGQQLAIGHGWWLYDMGGGWYEPDGIAADIADAMRTIRAQAGAKPSAWRPSAAVVIDEEGGLLRNKVHPKHYYDKDEENLVAGSQMQLLAASAAPYDIWLLQDFLDRPELARRYRTLVFGAMHLVDAKRKALLDALKSDGRTLVFLSGTGVCGGSEATGFEILDRPGHQDHVVINAPGVDLNLASYAEYCHLHKTMGQKVPNYYRSRRDAIVAKPGVDILATFGKGGDGAVAEARHEGWTGVYIASAAGLTPQHFNRIVRASGGYAAIDGYGIQVDMNGGFLSVHAFVPGHYDLRLPFACTVTNLKTGRPERTGGQTLPLDLVAGETCWFALEAKR